jgi:tryptophan-rich sensory protein
MVRLRSLLAFGAVTALVAWLGSVATTSNVDSEWFRSLEKPTFYPPDALFGIVWTFLYIGIAVAGWLAWRRAGGLSTLLPWTVQLVLNLGWTVFFFAAQQPGWAMVVIVALLAAAVWTAWAMWQHSHTATYLFVPYILWIGFAGVLNWSIIALN